MTDLQFASGLSLAALAVGILALFLWSGVAIGLRDLDARLRRIAAEAARDALAEAQAGRARRQNLDPALVRVPVMTLAEFDAVHAPAVSTDELPATTTGQKLSADQIASWALTDIRRRSRRPIP